ncbi:hypothetical protein AVEN_219114-1 [Araneus ventricosus]|uniref:Secreted protein n=1 Tax=Araneus ventricosus TaxID=182803 RepID=A0A4Y2T1H1_ARAVE|nr:hypothetical protein AVEN_219114-1 [Araneus ventricosus]
MVTRFELYLFFLAVFQVVRLRSGASDKRPSTNMSKVKAGDRGTPSALMLFKSGTHQLEEDLSQISTKLRFDSAKRASNRSKETTPSPWIRDSRGPPDDKALSRPT